jgi:hypothetical protein
MNSTWPLRAVAQAADMKPRALRQWFETGVLELTGADRKSSGSGVQCGLSRQRAYQAAIVQHLTRLGMTVSRAANSAFQFTDCGNTGRAPGELFEHHKTVLVITPECTTVKNISYDAMLTDISNRAVCAIIVDINQIVHNVNSQLESF